MRKAASMISIHLSYNPFLMNSTQEDLEEIREIIHAKPLKNKEDIYI